MLSTMKPFSFKLFKELKRKKVFTVNIELYCEALEHVMSALSLSGLSRSVLFEKNVRAHWWQGVAIVLAWCYRCAVKPESQCKHWWKVQHSEFLSIIYSVRYMCPGFYYVHVGLVYVVGLMLKRMLKSFKNIVCTVAALLPVFSSFFWKGCKCTNSHVTIFVVIRIYIFDVTSLSSLHSIWKHASNNMQSPSPSSSFLIYVKKILSSTTGCLSCAEKPASQWPRETAGASVWRARCMSAIKQECHKG